ncbi:hypothetical protein EVAR_99199_1 [Eumeta japonica]|uniref:Uncharacterized protein n=1 Tax=Eumeta variegata TaxID=151549 RepID=A0A4C1YTG9_EUMVA|nr:hypothetical protein EVAR_99199_1 [Eumeta japonica]
MSRLPHSDQRRHRASYSHSSAAGTARYRTLADTCRDVKDYQRCESTPIRQCGGIMPTNGQIPDCESKHFVELKVRWNTTKSLPLLELFGCITIYLYVARDVRVDYTHTCYPIDLPDEDQIVSVASPRSYYWALTDKDFSHSCISALPRYAATLDAEVRSLILDAEVRSLILACSKIL